MPEGSSPKGVTHSIRDRLNFNDDVLWKRFSARRLELIDTLDLSSKKASEQDYEISKVSDALRMEFNYPESYTTDFNKLVRAAIQSVRRNRKRLSRTKNNNGYRFVEDRPEYQSHREYHDHRPDLRADYLVENDMYRTHSQGDIHKSTYSSHYSTVVPPLHGVHDYRQLPRPYQPMLPPSTSLPNINQTTNSDNHQISGANRLPTITGAIHGDSHHQANGSVSNTNEAPRKRQRFISEITKLNSSSSDEHDKLYSRRVVLDPTSHEKSKRAVTTLLAPSGLDASRPKIRSRIGPSQVLLPALSPWEGAGGKVNPISEQAAAALASISSYVQRSKTCSDYSASRMRNFGTLEAMGRAVVQTVISYNFIKYFAHVSPSSTEYLSGKLNSVHTLAKIMRNLGQTGDAQDPSLNLDDHDSVMTLCILIAGCVTDFGFDCIVQPLSEVLHDIVHRDYPLISQHKSKEHKNEGSTASPGDTPLSFHTTVTSVGSNGAPSENANAVSTRHVNLVSPGHASSTLSGSHSGHISVLLKFSNKTLNFTYQPQTSAPPTFTELVVNGKSAFSIRSDTKVLKLRSVTHSGEPSTTLMSTRHAPILLHNDHDVARALQDPVYDAKTQSYVVVLELFVMDGVRRLTSPAPGSGKIEAENREGPQAKTETHASCQPGPVSLPPFSFQRLL